jgi:ADP-heptose:LPS heptosyltransferase
MARGAKSERGRRIAFGDKKSIRWDKHSAEIFRGNPNIAPPGSERDQDIEWRLFFKGHRVYNSQHPSKPRWIWNYDFRPTPGEVFFDSAEKRNALRFGSGLVIVEPNVPWWKSVAPNKDWGLGNYQRVADQLRAEGHRVVQFRHDKADLRLEGVEQLRTLNFRDALGIMSKAALYVGPEGGLHHGAAAMGTKAVVLFGGFIPPEVTGYEDHANLTGGAEACGTFMPCDHCLDAMKSIGVDEVLEAARERLADGR